MVAEKRIPVRVMPGLLALALAFVPIPSVAQYTHDFIGGADVYAFTLVVRQDPSSQVELNRAFLVNIAPMLNPAASSDDVENGIALGESYMTDECVVYTNNASQPLKHIRVLLSYLSPDGKAFQNDNLDVSDTVAPGATHGTFPIPYTGGCMTSGARIGNKAPYYYPTGNAIAISAAIVEVDYADGTSWHAPTIASPAATPNPRAT